MSNIFDEVNEIANGKVKLKKEKTNVINNANIFDEVKNLSGKNLKVKEKTTSNQADFKPLNITEFVNSVIPQQQLRQELAKVREEEKKEQERWDNLSLGEKIADPFKTMGANIKYGDLGIEENQAWNEYRSKQDEESYNKALAATKAREEYEANNDRIGKGNALTKDFAQYLPQLGGQLKSGLGGAAGGAAGGAVGGAGIALAAGQLGPQVMVPEEIATVPAGAITGAIWGGRGGYVAGTAKYGYDVMAGNAYKTLLDMGVPNDVALELSGDEALVNSLIEGGGAVVDLITLGIGKLGTKGATTATKKVAQNRLLAAAKAYGLNLATEPLEEMAQEKVSIETEKKAADISGIERQSTEAQDADRIKEAGIGALKVSAISGLGNAGGNVITNTVSDKITQNNINKEIKKQEIQDNINTYKKTSDFSKYIMQPQENRISNVELPKQQNIANNEIMQYNNNRGVENEGNKLGRMLAGDNESSGIYKENKSEQTQEYTRAGYEQFEKSIKPIPEERITDRERELVQQYKSKYNKDIVVFDGKENQGYLGGASLVDKNKIYVDVNSANEFGYNMVASHEVMESDILHNPELKEDLIKPLISKIINDPNFEQQKLEFWSGQEGPMPSDYLIAKDIICDRFADLDNNETLSYKNVLSQETNMTLDYGITNFRESIEKTNTQADEQSAFPMSENNIQRFASVEATRPYMDLNRYISTNKDSQTTKVSLTDIQNAINDIVPVKSGKFRHQAYGIYKTQGEIIRLKQTKDIPVALHELTHHLDKKYNLSSSEKISNELKEIAVVGKSATEQTKIKEGVAEFGRYYMTDKEYAKEIAPFYYDAFERALSNDLVMKNKIEEIRQMVSNYMEQSPINRLSSNIDYGDENASLWKKSKDTLIKSAKSFRKNFVDDLDPLKKIINEVAGDTKLMTEEDAYKLLRLNNGVTGKVQVALEYGVVDKNGKKIGKSLKEILRPVADKNKEFVAYITALRAKDLNDRGIESGLLLKDIEEVINTYKENDVFNKTAEDLYKFQNQILETTLVDSGIITKDAMKAYNKTNPHYIPFYRVMDENFRQNKDSKSKKPMKIKGSTRDIINPLESIIKNTYSYMQMAEKNETYKTLFNMANKFDGTGKWFDKVPTDMVGTKVTAEDVKSILEQLNLGEEDINYNDVFTTLFRPANHQKGNIVTVMNNGKPTHYEINDKELYEILSPTVKGDNFIVKMLAPASKALRVGATHTPEFILRNPLRDTIDAGIYSKNGFIPFIDTLIGIFNVASRSDLYYKWLEGGGSGSTYTNAQRPVLQKTLKGLTEGVTDEKGIKKVLKNVGDAAKHPLRSYLDLAGTISNVAEEGTRVGEFRRALQSGKSLKEAALDSREITLDFSRGGKYAKDINKVVAFFNAELQGLDKAITSIKDRPVATLVKALAYITLPAIILRGLQDEDELDKVPQWEKDEFFVFFINGTPIKIPKSQGLGQLFGTLPERAIDYIRTKDKNAFEGLMQRLITSYVPIDSTTAIFPNFFLPLIENSSNYSFFRQQPIVKQSLQNRSPKYQYDENTSTIAKKIGGAINYSPKKIDNLISGYFGNLGKDVANIAGVPFDIVDSLTTKEKEAKEYKSLNAQLKKIPLVKGFVASETSSKSLNKFYENRAKANTEYTDAKFKYSDGKMTVEEKKELNYYKEVNSLYTKAYSDIKEVDEKIDEVTKAPGSNKYKEENIEQLSKEKDNIAKNVEAQVDRVRAKYALPTLSSKRNGLPTLNK
ncbi:MAG: hypothetical protein E7314_05935 [Clostridiales bacterium]|nr:hypothetical protein [Clostridiales bacterium]